jgi:hypothetical protein
MSFTLLRFRYAANLAGVQLRSGIVERTRLDACSTSSKIRPPGSTETTA